MATPTIMDATTDAPSTVSVARTAARSVSAIAFNQFAQIVGSVLFVAFVPRALGTEFFGQLAFVFALITIFQMLGELGYQEIYSRFVPEVRHSAGDAGVRRLAQKLTGVKAIAGLGLGLAAVLGARLLAGWLTPEQAWLVGLTVGVRVWAMSAFPLLLGLGETLRWSVETTWRQIVVTVLILAFAGQRSLTASLVGMALHEVVFLLLGLWWARRWMWGMRSEKLEAGGAKPGFSHILPPTSHLLKFGFIFSLANFTLVLMFRISPITVEKLTGSHAETGFFDLALGGLLLVYTLLGQVAYAFVRILTQLNLERQTAQAEAWLGRFVRYATLLVGLAAGGMWAVAGPVAPLLFGEGFAPAAQTIRMMGFAMLPLPIAWAGVILSALDKRPLAKVWAALLGLAIFLALAVALRGYGSAGIALAFAGAMAGYSAGFGRGARIAVRAGGAGWALALGSSLLFAPLLLIRFPSLLMALATWAGTAGVYAVTVLAMGVVTPDEVRLLARAMWRR